MEFLQRSIDGLLEAGPYALIGLGLTLGFGVLRRLNLAYGAGALLAAYLGSWLHVRLGAPVWMVWLGVMCLSVIVGLYVDALCFAESDQPASALQRARQVVYGADALEVTALAATFAVWMQLEQLAVNWQPSHVHPFPDLSSTSEWTWSGWSGWGGLTLRPDRVAVWAFTVALLWSVAVWMTRSRLGLGLRAVASHPAAAHLSGMSVRRLQRLGFALACALGGVAACAVLSVDAQVTPMFGMWILVKGLTVALLAGLGRIERLLLGAAVLGVLESHAQALAGPLAREAVAWVLLLGVLGWQARRSKPGRSEMPSELSHA